jgi:hypothetical protein
VELHGSDNVKMAIDKALEKSKLTMTYIGGILKNWSGSKLGHFVLLQRGLEVPHVLLERIENSILYHI